MLVTERIQVRNLGKVEYQATHAAMRDFNARRDSSTPRTRSRPSLESVTRPTTRAE